MQASNTFKFLFLIIFISLSCTRKEIDLNEKVLNISVKAKVKGFDPILADDMYAGNEMARIYEGLLEYHYLKRPFELIPNLAESMPEVSKDGLTYTFKIRKGVMFQDNKAFANGIGRELVAADFAYSLKRLADPKLRGVGFWVLDGKIKGLNEWRANKNSTYDDEIEGIKALDKYTLQFKLTKPFPQFLYSLAMPFTFVVAKEAVDHYKEDFVNHPVGTGPFMLDVFRQGLKITYTKNPKFRDVRYPSEASDEFKHLLKDAGKKLPLVDKIIVHIDIEDSPRWLNFKKGNVDFVKIPKDNFSSAVGPDLGLTDDLKKVGVRLQILPSLDVTYTAFNHDLKLFQNLKLRRAMSMAIDPAKQNNLFYFGKAISAQSIIPPGIAGYKADYVNKYAQKNLKEAKRLLAEAGYPGGKGLPPITYDCSASSTSRQIGEFIAKELSQIGVKVLVRTFPWPELQKKVNNKKIMLYGQAWGADYPDAENFLQLLYGPNEAPGSNGSNFDNPEFNRLYVKASLMQHSPERTKLYEKLNKMAGDLVPWMYGVHRRYFVTEHAWLRNFIQIDFEWHQEKYLDVDMKKKSEVIKLL